MKYLLILLSLLVIGCDNRTGCEGDSYLIRSIGGCDAEGYCGVMLDDGTQARAYFPVNNQRVTKCIIYDRYKRPYVE